MGAGKSTMAAEVAKKNDALLLSEDEWLSTLYPGAISSLEDYIEYSRRIKPIIKSLVQKALASGIDVVIDFPANTVAQRKWLVSLSEEIEAAHQLLYLNVPNEICLEQIEKRVKDRPDRAKTDTKEMFSAVTKHFVEPSVNESLNIIAIDR